MYKRLPTTFPRLQQYCHRTLTTKVSISDVTPLQSKRVFVRADLNVPFDKEDPTSISDDTRIRGALPTLQHLTDAGARVVLASHLGRPKGQVNETMRLAPVAHRLAKYGIDVKTVSDCIGQAAEDAADSLVDGQVLLLENTRFHPGETDNDPEFAKALAQVAKPDIYVNDAFGAAHRAHGSTAGIAKHAKVCAAGLLMDKELSFLEGAVNGGAVKRPLIAVIGGAKVSSKIAVIESLLDKTDRVLIGGGMMWTIIKAMGYETADSLVEEDCVDVARATLRTAKSLGKEILLPVDAVVAASFSKDATHETMDIDQLLGSSGMGLDIGPKTIDLFRTEVLNAGTVIWNGPMGVFEFDAFATGAFAVANALADMTDKGGISIVGGGDSVAAIQASGLANKISHISTGGGASLELLEGKTLPGVDCLDDEK
jgi:phosphoglycerate kinase